FRLRLRDRDVRAKPGEHIEIAMATLDGILGRNERSQYIGAVPQHVRWEHADDRDRLAVDRERLADDGGVGSEAPLPISMRKQPHTTSPWAGFLSQNRTPEHPPPPQRPPPTAGDTRRVPRLARTAVHDRHALSVVGRHRLEYVILIVNVREIRV